jgi:hypothetical protein
MTTRTTVRTPLGDFPSLNSAAQAHRCDRATLAQRIKNQPDQYQKIQTSVKPPQSWVTRGVRWPIPWHQYRFQEESVKDAIYQAWCQKAKLDPDLESTANAFFDDMDQAQDTSTDTDTEHDQDPAVS